MELSAPASFVHTHLGSSIRMCLCSLSTENDHRLE